MTPNISLEELAFPKTVIVDTCSYCNLKCSMCPHVTMKRKKGRMDFGLFKKIIDEIAERSPSTRVWMVFFGEALILKKHDPSIFEMIRYAKAAGLKDLVLNSNGNLLDRESSVRLLDAGLDGIYIGIDAFSEETYAKLRVGGHYQQTVNNVLELVDVVKKTRRKDFDVQVQFVEMEENRGELEPFLKFWKSKGVSVKVRQKVSWGGLMGAENIPPKDQRHPCYWIMDTASITDTGDVVTCAADPEGRLVLGNMKTQSLQEVWDGSLGELRRLHKDGRWSELPEPCQSCQDWEASYKDQILSGENMSRVKKIIKKMVRFVSGTRR